MHWAIRLPLLHANLTLPLPFTLVVSLVHWALKRWDVFGPPNEEDTDTDIVIETNNNNYDNLSINDPINVHINNPISVHINDHINEKNSSDLGRR